MGKLSQAAGALAIMTMGSANAESIEAYNANKESAKENLAELFDEITESTATEAEDVYTTTAEDFGRINPEFTEAEKAMILNVSSQLKSQEKAVETASSADERATTQTTLDTYRATDTEFAALVTKRAFLLRRANEEEQYSRNALEEPDRIFNGSPSKETRDRYDGVSLTHSVNKDDYRRLYKELSFLEEREIMSQYEKTSLGATNFAEITPDSPLGKLFEKMQFETTTSSSGRIKVSINKKENVGTEFAVFNPRHDLNYKVYPEDSGFTVEKAKLNGKTYFIHFAIQGNEVIETSGYERDKLDDATTYKIPKNNSNGLALNKH